MKIVQQHGNTDDDFIIGKHKSKIQNDEKSSKRVGGEERNALNQKLSHFFKRIKMKSNSFESQIYKEVINREAISL